jgi:hypothetical protein
MSKSALDFSKRSKSVLSSTKTIDSQDGLFLNFFYIFIKKKINSNIIYRN